MKTKFNLLFVMLLSSLCITFTSCSDDDDDDKTTDYAKEIAGTYKGDVFPDGVDQAIATDATITITRNSDTNVSLKMEQEIANVGTIKVDCKSDVAYTSEKYEIAKTTTTAEVKGMPIPVTVNGNVDKSGNATINIEIPLLENMKVVYKGKKQ